MCNLDILWKSFLVLILYLLLSGCQSFLSPKKSIPKLNTSQQLLTEITNWNLQGKIGVQAPEKFLSVLLSWQQIDSHYSIQLFSPLGQTLADIEGTGINEPSGAVTVRTHDHKTYQGHTPEALIKQYAGLTVPISHLFYWIRGLPAPNHQNFLQKLFSPTQFNYNERGYLTELRQDGWQLHFLEYSSYGDIQLPRKLLIERGHLKMTLLLKSWQLPS